MKNVTWILVVVALSANVANAQVTNKDEMVKKIFTTLHQKDEKGFIKLFLDVATVKKFVLETLKADTTMNARSKADEKEILASMTDSAMQKGYQQEFKQAIQLGEKKGVDWSKARLISYTVGADGVDTIKLKGKIYFNVNQKEYYIAFRELIWLKDKGFFSVDIARVDEKSNEGKAGDDPGLGYADDTKTMTSSECMGLREMFDQAVYRLDSLTGRNIELEKQADSLKRDITKTKIQIKNLLKNSEATKSQLESDKKLITDLNKWIADQDAEIKRLEAEVKRLSKKSSG